MSYCFRVAQPMPQPISLVYWRLCNATPRGRWMPNVDRSFKFSPGAPRSRECRVHATSASIIVWNAKFNQRLRFLLSPCVFLLASISSASYSSQGMSHGAWNMTYWLAGRRYSIAAACECYTATKWEYDASCKTACSESIITHVCV